MDDELEKLFGTKKIPFRELLKRTSSYLKTQRWRFVLALFLLLLNVLRYKPFLIKPNNHELGEMFKTVLKTDDEIEEHARKLQDMGARNVLISMAGDGAMLITEDGQRFRVGVPKGKVKNSVGAGDSMVAGFVAGYMKTKDYRTALNMGTAAGSATAFSDDLATGELINDIYETL